MACNPDVLKNVPLFALLDDEERALLASQVDMRSFSARERIYKVGDPGSAAYVVVSGRVSVFTVDDDQQEVVVDEPGRGEFFGFASMLEQSPHQTNAMAIMGTVCLEVSFDDIAVLLTQKPMAGMDLMTTLGRQLHSTQALVRGRASRNPNDVIENVETTGERIADHVARFGGSWTFIVTFAVVLSVYTAANVFLDKQAWDPYPFILLNLFLSMLAAIQAPVIMMSQNRQDSRDRLRAELDFDVNKRAESEIQGVSRKMGMLDQKMDDIADLLRKSASDGQPAGE
jgi:uncharacterized membrane protein